MYVGEGLDYLSIDGCDDIAALQAALTREALPIGINDKDVLGHVLRLAADGQHQKYDQEGSQAVHRNATGNDNCPMQDGKVF